MKAEVETLDCGLEAVFLRHDIGTSGASARLSFNTGALHESETDTPGTAHYLEHVGIVTGTSSYPSSEQLFNALDRYNTDFNGFTDWTSTCIKIEGPHAAFAIALCLEMGFAPILSKAAVEQDRQAIQEEARGYNHGPWSALEDSIFKLFIGDHPSRSITGSVHDVSQITHQDVKRFHEQHWRPSNARLYVVSDESVGSMRRIANSFFQDLPYENATQKPSPIKLDLPWLSEPNDTDVQLCSDDETQSHIVVAYPLASPESFEDYVLDTAAIQLINVALWRQIRLRQNITYYAGAGNIGYSNTAHGAKELYNSLFISSAIHPMNVGLFFDALKTLTDRLPTLQTLGASILREYIYWLNGKSDYFKTEVADDLLFSEQIGYKKIYSPRDEKKVVRSLSTRDVLNRAQGILNGVSRTIVTGHSMHGQSSLAAASHQKHNLRFSRARNFSNR